MNKLIQKLQNLLSLNKYLLIFILCFYIAIGHIFLPLFGKRDFYFLFNWNLFTFMPPKFTHDITWNGGETFLLRDYGKQIENRHTFRSLVIKKKIDRIRKDYKNQLLEICQCKSMYFVTLNGLLIDHLIHKKPLEIVESIEL